MNGFDIRPIAIVAGASASRGSGASEECMERLEGGMEVLAKEFRGGLKEVRAAVAGKVEPKRGYVPGRVYPQLVTLEAEPDEDLVYRDATPVIVE